MTVEIRGWPVLLKLLRVGRHRIDRWRKFQGFPEPRLLYKPNANGKLVKTPYWCAVEVMHWWQDYDHSQEYERRGNNQSITSNEVKLLSRPYQKLHKLDP